MKVGDLVKHRGVHPWTKKADQAWLVTDIAHRGSDHRGNLVLCKIHPTFTDKVGAIWKWRYELRKMNRVKSQS